MKKILIFLTLFVVSAVYADDHENVIRHGAICDGTTDNSTAFIAANAAATISGKRVYIPSCQNGQDYVVDANVVFSNPVEFASEALLDIQSGDSITFNDKSFTAPKETIFIGSGSVSFGTEQKVFPQWWGGIGDGNDINASVNVNAIQSAINSLTVGDVIIDGEFRVALDTPGNSDIFILKSNVNIVGVDTSSAIIIGVDTPSSIIKLTNTAGESAGYIFGTDGAEIDNVTITNLTFDYSKRKEFKD